MPDDPSERVVRFFPEFDDVTSRSPRRAAPVPRAPRRTGTKRYRPHTGHPQHDRLLAQRNIRESWTSERARPDWPEVASPLPNL
jgi:hypothetical protein